MADYLLNQSLEDAIDSIHQIENIVSDNADKVADQALNFFKLLHQYPTRKGCVLINTKTLLKFLNHTLTNR
jgi:NifU-like protein involved in Fe-S cluster formation